MLNSGSHYPGLGTLLQIIAQDDMHKVFLCLSLYFLVLQDLVGKEKYVTQTPSSLP